jgi:dihydrofolate reductase
MGKLTYGALASLDGFIEDEQGQFDWAQPEEDVHRYINALEAKNAVFLYGRKLFQTMVWWESQEQFSGYPDYIQDYGRIWRNAEKIVYSRTLPKAGSEKTVIKPEFIPEEVRLLKETLAGDMSIGGAELAGAALSSGLVDDIYLFVFPVIVGKGKTVLQSRLKINLALEETKRFRGGVVLLHYRCIAPGFLSDAAAAPQRGR